MGRYRAAITTSAGSSFARWRLVNTEILTYELLVILTLRKCCKPDTPYVVPTSGGDATMETDGGVSWIFSTGFVTLVNK